jgi:hypothetical protein
MPNTEELSKNFMASIVGKNDDDVIKSLVPGVDINYFNGNYPIDMAALRETDAALKAIHAHIKQHKSEIDLGTLRHQIEIAMDCISECRIKPDNLTGKEADEVRARNQKSDTYKLLQDMLNTATAKEVPPTPSVSGNASAAAISLAPQEKSKS